MKTVTLGLVVVVALYGVVFESHLEPLPKVKSPRPSDLDQDQFEAFMRETDRLLISLRLESGTPRYMSRLGDPGIMTHDWKSICTYCEGWGIQNRHLGDRAVFCESCDRTGLTQVPRAVAAAPTNRVTRVLER